MSRKTFSPARTLRYLGFKQTIKGATIIGLLTGMLIIVQGIGYIATYPDAKSQAQFAASLESAPALGVLYGEPKNLVSASGYIVYRVVPFMSFIASIWGLATVTKLLRGQEEDGRWELITANNISARGATRNVLFGFGGSLTLAFFISTAIAATTGFIPDINLSISTIILLTLAIFSPVLTFIGLGIFASQLSITRRRALLYGLVPLLVFFMLRALGNTIDDVYWLKYLTPFGWSDLVSPVIDPRPIWLLAHGGLVVVLAGIGLYLVGRRDLGAGILKESSTAKPRYALLGSVGAQAIRQFILPCIAWGLSALGVSGLIGAISGIAAQSLVDSPAAEGVVTQLGGTEDLKTAIIGAGLVFTVMILLVMATISMSAIRSSEAKNYLDNILVQPVRRSVWLSTRLVIIVAGITIISLACGFITWLIASTQDITLDLANLLLISLTLTGTVILTLGFGTLLYGLVPRIATIGMYMVLGWSFVIDAIGSVVKLDPLIVNSSLFHYVSLSPTKSPDWVTFAWLCILGVIMAIAGIITLSKRDIITE